MRRSTSFTGPATGPTKRRSDPAPRESHPNPAGQYRHDHPRVRNLNKKGVLSMTFGQRVADRVATTVGSCPFIQMQSILLCIWMGMNAYLVVMEHARPWFLWPGTPIRSFC